MQVKESLTGQPFREGDFRQMVERREDVIIRTVRHDAVVTYPFKQTVGANIENRGGIAMLGEEQSRELRSVFCRLGYNVS